MSTRSKSPVRKKVSSKSLRIRLASWLGRRLGVPILLLYLNQNLLLEDQHLII